MEEVLYAVFRRKYKEDQYNMNRFTFGVMVYNQEKIVLETLNSIKYQVVNFGKEYDTQIIFTDDNSSDNTVKVIETWLDTNRSMFCTVIKRWNHENLGTSSNYNYILEHIDNEPFKIIAGDDIIASNNIYSETIKLMDNEIKNYLRCYLKNGKVYIDEYAIRMHFVLSNKTIEKKQQLSRFYRGRIIHTPSTLYLKSLYKASNAKNHNMKYFLFEDNPTWYTMLINVPKSELTFCNRILVLYRISEKSVSNSDSDLNKLFIKELKTLYQEYLNTAKLFDRLYIKSKIKSFDNTGAIFYRIEDKLVNVYCKLYCNVFHRKKFREFNEKYIKMVEIEQKYYNTEIMYEGK